MGSSSILSGPTARLVYALVWTTLIAVALLKPANNFKHEISLDSFVSSFFSLSIKTWDLVEAVYHVIVFAILTAIWFWALVTQFPRNRALVISIGIAMVLGIVTEIGQYFVHRSSLMLDAMANFLGIVICVVWLKYNR